jgi:hypothetical protein
MMNFNQTITEGGEIILGNGRQQKDLAEIRYFLLKMAIHYRD